VKTRLGIGEGIGTAVESPRHLTFYVSLADINAALAIIEEKGGRKTFGPHPTRTAPPSRASSILRAT
jgi:predicted enzyme related to lactoylglutathione lyase